MEQQSEVKSEQQAIEQSRMAYQVDELKQELTFTKDVLERIQQNRTDAEKLAALLGKQHGEVKKQVTLDQQKYQQHLQDLGKQRDQIVAALRDAFADSSDELEKLLDEIAASSPASQTLPKQQIDQLANKLVESEAHELVTFLMAYEEIRKRCDVWEIHLDQRGIAHLIAGKHRSQIRVTSIEDFQRQLFETYKSLPQTKGLVIILVSYEEVARSLRESLLLSLPEATNRMREDADGRTRFEYAVIGYLPKTVKEPKP
ncbi:MAG: hypothetical protein JKY95_11435 [Planctomycetaceae bacterium]|nr:hypothetical protein [Planctomycetaceae bacterium]